MATISRRTFLAGAVATSVGAPLIARPGFAASPMGFEEARHLLARTTFGAAPSEIRKYEALDIASAVDLLLGNTRPSSVTPDPNWFTTSPAELVKRQKSVRSEAVQANEPAMQGHEPGRMNSSKKPQLLPMKETRRELIAWWIDEMLATNQPVAERMVLFWHGHFTSSFKKVRFAPSLFRQNALFRREALGNFATLLGDVARDPAMLAYLDGVRNIAGKPNENFARELLELFTLGEGHYTDEDVKAAARAFTGWSVSRSTGEFVNRTDKHDDGEKSFLGQSGRFGPTEIIAILLKHPRTAETVVEKLWVEFISFRPDPDEVKRLASYFRKDYDIRKLMREMLVSNAFRDPANRASLIKAPIEMVIGTARLLDTPLPLKSGVVQMLDAMGQVPFEPPNVKGWIGGENWITTYTFLQRQQFLRRIIETTSVASSESMVAKGQRSSRQAERRQMAPDDATIQLMDDGTRDTPQAKLGPTLSGSDPMTLLSTLLPRSPVLPLKTSGMTPAAAVAAALLDPAYQLK